MSLARFSGDESQVRKSFLNTSSLRPQSEFETIKIVILREKYIKKLSKALKKLHDTDDNIGIDMGIIGLIDCLRSITIETIEVIKTWQESQVTYPEVKDFIWDGRNYHDKIAEDLSFLSTYPVIQEWLGFSVVNNPFLVPPDLLFDGVELDAKASIMFGSRPTVRENAREKALKPKFIKTPYLTPIINDVVVVSDALNVRRSYQQMVSDQKKKADFVLDKRKNNNHEVVILDKEETLQRRKLDPYECILTSETVTSIQKAWKILTKYVPQLKHDMLQSLVLDGRINADQLGRSFPPPIDTLAPWQTGEIDDDRSTHDGLFQRSVDTLSQTSTNLFATTYDSYEKMSDPFHASLDNSAVLKEELSNKYMRMSTLQLKGNISQVENDTAASVMSSVDSKFDDGLLSSTLLASSTSSVKVWTPHEIILQQQATQRKGGELYILTAAGTKGHMKAPWRASRFQRLERDMQRTGQQLDALKKAKSDGLYKFTNEDTLVNEAKEVSPRSKIDIQRVVDDAVVGEDVKHISDGVEEVKVNSSPSISMQTKVEIESDKNTKNMNELLRSVEKQLSFMKYQFEQFKLISEGESMTSLDKLRKINKLNDGEAIASDEKLSVSLEDTMATKIQWVARKKFARALRQVLWKKLNKAAFTITGFIVKYNVRYKANKYMRSVRLAFMLQKLYRGGQGLEYAAQLRREAEEYAAILIVQRVFRGMKGRKKAKVKRHLLREIEAMNDRVSIKELKPGDVDGLADTIEDYMNDFSYDLPVDLLSVLRVVLLFMNGEEAESIAIDNGGIVEEKSIYGLNASWYECRLILKRKGRFLRRVRGFAASIKHPFPFHFIFSSNTVKAMNEVVDNVKEEIFSAMKTGQKASIQLYRFVLHAKEVYDLQNAFPDYYSSGIPLYFKELLLAAESQEADLVKKILYDNCLPHLQMLLGKYIAEGKKYKYVSASIELCTNLLDTARENHNVSQMVYDRFLFTFRRKHNEKMVYLKDLQRYQQLNVEVLERDLEEYIRVNFCPNQEYIRDVNQLIDLRTLELLHTSAEIQHNEQHHNVAELCFKYEDHVGLQYIRDNLCTELGRTEAELMVINEKWKEFSSSIGGMQFVYDLVGTSKETYLLLRNSAIELMATRRRLLQEIREGIRRELLNAEDYALRVIDKYAPKTWDIPTPIEKRLEALENFKIAKFENDQAAKALRLANRTYIAPADIKPVIVFIDILVPSTIRQEIIKKLVGLNFVAATNLLDNPNIAIETQDVISAHKNLIIQCDRGITVKERGVFRVKLDLLVQSLVPKPKVIILDATQAIKYDCWILDSAVKFKSNEQLSDHNNAPSTQLLIAKVKSIAEFFHLCQSHIQDVMMEEIHSDHGHHSSTQVISNIPDTTLVASRLDSTQVADKPDSRLSGSRPGSTPLDQIPNISQVAGITDSAQVCHRPNSAQNASRPSSTQVDSRPGTTPEGAQDYIDLVEPSADSADINNQEEVDNDDTLQSNVVIVEAAPAECEDNTEDIKNSFDECSVIDGTVAEAPMRPGVQIFNDLLGDPKSRSININGRNITHDFIRNFSQDWESFLQRLSACCGDESETADPDVIMVLIMCSIMDYWDGPMVGWGQPQCQNGVTCFLELIENDYSAFCDSLSLSSFPQCQLSDLAVLKHNNKLVNFYNRLSNINPYLSPARYLIGEWCRAAVDLMETIAVQGGSADATGFKINCDGVVYLNWYDNIYEKKTDEIVGSLMKEYLEDYKIYEDKYCPLTKVTTRGVITDLDQQELVSEQTSGRVTVAYSGSTVYMGVEFFDDEPTTSIDVNEESMDESAHSLVASAKVTASRPSTVTAPPGSDEVTASRPSSVTAPPGSRLGSSDATSGGVKHDSLDDSINLSGVIIKDDTKVEQVKSKFSLASFFGFGGTKKVPIASSTEEASGNNDVGISTNEAPIRVDVNTSRSPTPKITTNGQNSRPTSSNAVAVQDYAGLNESLLELTVDRDTFEAKEMYRNDGDDKDSSQIIPRKPRVYYLTNSITNLIIMLQPNATEIFEGNIKRYDISDKGNIIWYELFSKWIKLNYHEKEFNISAIRARYLLYTKIGLLSGYFGIRMEIFEQIFGEFYIVFYGIPVDHNAAVTSPNSEQILTYYVKQDVIFTLLSICHEFDEKPYLETLDALGMSNIFSDRLELFPTRKWRSFLAAADLPSTHSRPMQLKLRKVRGPGRLIGNRLLKYDNVNIFILSVYEISSSSELNVLRLVLYSVRTSTAIEYRVSTLERVLYFTNKEPIINQILKRFKVVKRVNITMNDKSNGLGHLPDVLGQAAPVYNHNLYHQLTSTYAPSITKAGTYEVDNTSEYDIVNPDLLTTSETSDNNDDAYEKIPWIIYFNRDISVETRGNLLISMSICTFDRANPLGDLHVYDHRMFIETYAQFQLKQIVNVLANQGLRAMLSTPNLREVNESVMLSLADAILDTICVVDAYHALVDNMSVVGIPNPSSNTTNTSNDGTDSNLLVTLGYLLPHEITDEDTNDKRRIVNTEIIPSKRVEVCIHSAEGLSKFESIAPRDAYCICYFNMREIGRSLPVDKSLNPEWDILTNFKTKKGTSIDTCTLEIEVHDSGTETRQGEFLGVVILTGTKLSEFLSSESKTKFELQPSKKRDQKENSAVGGFLYLTGSLDTRTPGKFGSDLSKATGISNISRGFSNIGRNMSFKLPSGGRGMSFRGGISNPRSFLSSASNFISNSILSIGPVIEKVNEFIQDDNDEVIGELEKSIKANESYEFITTHETEADKYEYCYPGFTIIPVTDVVGATKLVTTDNIDNVSLSVSNASDDDDDDDGDDDDDDDIKNTVAEDDPYSSAVTRSHVSLTKDAEAPAAVNEEVGKVETALYATAIRRNYNHVQEEGIKNVTFGSDKLELKNRICFKGRVKPEIDKSEADADTESLFVSRSSRIVQCGQLHEISVYTTTHTMKEMKQKSNVVIEDLPVTVEEVVNNGPDLCRRLYRVEILSNRGVKLGGAEIMDDDDLLNVAGKECSSLHLSGPKQLWNLSAAFEYIVYNRAKFSFATKKQTKLSVTGAMSNMFSSLTNAVTGTTVAPQLTSAVTLIRDTELEEERRRRENTILNRMSNILVSKKVEQVEEDTQSEASSVDSKLDEFKYWERIYKSTHKMSGHTFNTMILFLSNDANMVNKRDAYFRHCIPRKLFSEGHLKVLIKSEDLVTNEKHKLEFSGSDMLAWLPSHVHLDFTTRHRREVIGKLLVKNLTMRYTRWGTSIIDLVNENTKVLNTAAATDIYQRKAKVEAGDTIGEEKN